MLSYMWASLAAVSNNVRVLSQRAAFGIGVPIFDVMVVFDFTPKVLMAVTSDSCLVLADMMVSIRIQKKMLSCTSQGAVGQQVHDNIFFSSHIYVKSYLSQLLAPLNAIN